VIASRAARFGTDPDEKGLQARARSLDRAHVRSAFVVGSCLLLALSGAWVDARADELSDIEKAYAAYAAHKYVDAEERLRTLLDPVTGTLKDPDRIADARMYLGTVLLAEHRRADALSVFQRLLLDKEDYQPDPLRVPLEALDALIDVRAEIRQKVRALQVERARQQLDEQAKIEAEKQRAAARVAVLEKLASEQVLIERHSRWIGLLPFGIGQFQNRQDALGWTFLTTESLLAVGSAISAGLTVYNEANASNALAASDVPRASGYNARAHGDWEANVAFAGAFVAVAIVGILQAELTYAPAYVQVRKRELPTISVTPTVGPGGIGLIGRF
jgi:hypothetical protein